jgi:hypothetical protein
MLNFEPLDIWLNLNRPWAIHLYKFEPSYHNTKRKQKQNNNLKKNLKQVLQISAFNHNLLSKSPKQRLTQTTFGRLIVFVPFLINIIIIIIIYYYYSLSPFFLWISDNVEFLSPIFYAVVYQQFRKWQTPWKFLKRRIAPLMVTYHYVKF